jgi:hypothetical protein
MLFGGKVDINRSKKGKVMVANQLNKLQIKAEILTILSKLQTNPEALNVEELLTILVVQEDKKSILEILLKEFAKANEQKVISICFLLLRLCDESEVVDALWEVLKTPSIKDSTKTIILNLLKDLGNKVDYEKLDEYFENPAEAIDSDTQRLLHVAIVNPEAQIDFLDFVYSLRDSDRKVLIQSLGDDYSSDDLANILNPLVLYEPVCELSHIAIGILGSTKSQLALHTLLESLEFVTDEETISLIKKNISTLKISGIREDNAIEFYKSVLSTKPYCSYASYPDGHGNQALIFSRERENESVQVVAVVINDTFGIVDCFGFNEISKDEFERIVNRFYNNDEHVHIDSHVLKSILLNAEKLTRKAEGKLSYEYICWRTLLSDIQIEQVPIELILKTAFEAKVLSEKDLEKICLLDFVQRWFFDTENNSDFKSFISVLNSRISANDFGFDLEETINKNLDKIFISEQKNLLDKRILMSTYLKYLAGENEDAMLLYSLYFDENKKSEVAKNIIRKSVYEYYVSLKFKYKEANKMTNIFAMRNKPNTAELTPKQIDSTISVIENLWVK